MTPTELKAARKALGLGTGRFAVAFGASDGRIVRRWEHGDYPVPRSLALLVRLALDSAWVRRRLEIDP